MARTWQSWLIPGPEPIREGLEGGLRETFSLSDNVKFDPRPTASLDLHDGRWALRTERRDAFFQELGRLLKAADDRGVLAISFAPIEQLRKLGLGQLKHDTRRYLVTWEGDTLAPGGDPYARRLVRITRAGSSIAKSLLETQIANLDEPGASLLILDPIRVEIEEDDAAGIEDGLESDGRLWMLPPVRGRRHPFRRRPNREAYPDEGPTTYFSDEEQSCRLAVRGTLAAVAPSETEPTAISLGRMVDDPLLRDILMEGGAVRVTAGADRRTGLALDLCVSPSPMAAVRAAFLRSESPPPPPWANELAVQVRRDLETLFPDHPIQAVESPVDWRLPEPTVAQGLVNQPWGWAVLERLRDQVALEDEMAGRHLYANVLQPTNVGAQYNNDRALELYLARFWRQPWSEASPAWRHAYRDVHWKAFGPPDLSTPTPETPEVRRALLGDVEQWARVFSHTLVGQAPARIRFRGAPDADQMLHWRLVYPLGTAFEAQTLVLDGGERSRLDAGYLVA
jgi:hypothetical protein